LAAAADHAGKVVQHTGLPLDGVDEVLRAARFGGGAAECGQQRRHGGADSGLCIVAIETEGGGNAADHVRRQELHHIRNEIGCHHAPPLAVDSNCDYWLPLC
jgi:hypothetical protein